jgi:hypothetical protein
MLSISQHQIVGLLLSAHLESILTELVMIRLHITFGVDLGELRKTKETLSKKLSTFPSRFKCVICRIHVRTDEKCV